MLYSVLFVSCPCILIPRHNISIDYKLFRPFFGLFMPAHLSDSCLYLSLPGWLYYSAFFFKLNSWHLFFFCFSVHFQTFHFCPIVRPFFFLFLHGRIDRPFSFPMDTTDCVSTELYFGVGLLLLRFSIWRSSKVKVKLIWEPPFRRRRFDQFFSAIFLCERSRRDQSPRRELDQVPVSCRLAVRI